MIVIFLLIPLSIGLATVFLGAFIWAVRSGQYEDTCTPAMRAVMEEQAAQPAGQPPGSGPGGTPGPPRTPLPSPAGIDA